MANDIGRNNSNGEPDPDGSWSSGRKPTQDTFYMIAFNIWNWVDATRFFNQHTNPETKDRRVSGLLREMEEVVAERDASQNQLDEANYRADEYTHKINTQQAELHSQQAEIMRLKAKLFDLMEVSA